jgi:hypothetical protein
MYFLRKAQDIYRIKPSKELSPSFWDSEGKSPTSIEGLEEIMSGIEHPLGLRVHRFLIYAASILIILYYKVDYCILPAMSLALLSCSWAC